MDSAVALLQDDKDRLPDRLRLTPPVNPVMWVGAGLLTHGDRGPCVSATTGSSACNQGRRLRIGHRPAGRRVFAEDHGMRDEPVGGDIKRSGVNRRGRRRGVDDGGVWRQAWKSKERWAADAATARRGRLALPVRSAQ